MKILIGCEYSGTVRDAFIRAGHDAMSCDILPTMRPGPHYEGDLMDVLYKYNWDMVIAFPPCTHLSYAGAQHFKKKRQDGRQQNAVNFVKNIWLSPIKKICIENPRGHLFQAMRQPDQIINPWQFGHEAQKTTCLWLKGLPKLIPTKIVDKGEFHEYISKTTGKIKRQPLWFYKCWGKKNCDLMRSKTFDGIAEAMASQWGKPAIVQSQIDFETIQLL
jgi:site-specific DNA-cytosine methylase